jgi:sulfoxide reductase heme-binding subunit YedZ
MSHTYQAVGWNPFKRRYDTVLGAAVVAWLALFTGATLVVHPDATFEIALIRATGTGGFFLLHVILCVGPLARINRMFLPLLYNRRHLGVTMFLLALAHAALVIATYHAGSDMNPFASVFLSDAGPHVAAFPFQALGAIALIILFLMAATSHDFWLSVLKAPVWKALHMAVYVAYALLIVHVAFGALQAETHPGYVVATAVGIVVVFGLHLSTGWHEVARDRPPAAAPGADGFVEVCGVEDIPEKRARVFFVPGERVAIFRYDGKLSAVSSVCQHQNGPLGEGRILDGCITCPWHGYQYLPATGASPPPFAERVPTFHVRAQGGRVWIHPRPNPAGTHVEPAVIAAAT